MRNTIRAFASILLILTVAACGTDGPGATGSPLALATKSGVGGGCPQAGLEPVRIVRLDGEMVFLSVANGTQVGVVWPHGFAARLVNGQAELIASDGTVIGREGDELSNLGGGPGPEAFFVCSVGAITYP